MRVGTRTGARRPTTIGEAEPRAQVADAEGGDLADQDDPPSEEPRQEGVPGRLRTSRSTSSPPAGSRKKRR
jgi:hypothetical protein